MRYLITLLTIISALSLNAQADTTEFTSSLSINSMGRFTLVPDSISYDTTEVAAFVYSGRANDYRNVIVRDTTHKFGIDVLTVQEVPSFAYYQEILHKVTKTTHCNNTYLLWAVSVDVLSFPTEITYYNYKWEVVPTKSIFAKVDIDE